MLARLSLRFLTASPGLALINILAIAIGISVPVAVQVANESALSAFKDTLDVVTGKANVEISADGRQLNESIFRDIKLHPGIRAASPLVEGIVILKDFPGEYIRILGIDPFFHRPFSPFTFTKSKGNPFRSMDQPGAIALMDAFAKKLKIHEGDSIHVETDAGPQVLLFSETLRFENDSLNADEHLAVMDIASAQELLQSYGSLNKISILSEGSPQELVTSLEKTMPPGVHVKSSERRGTQIDAMLGAFRLNLFALSLIALIVAAFLFYSSLSTLVLRQRKGMGVLRAIGFNPSQVRNLLWIQSMAISGIGILLGLAAGLGVARGSLDAMSQAVSSVYLLVHIQRLSWSPELLAQSAGIGLLFCACATWLPARECAAIKPVEAFQLRDPTFVPHSKSTLRLALLFLLGAVGSSFAALHTSFHWLGFQAALLWMLTLTCLIPVGIESASRLLRKVFKGILFLNQMKGFHLATLHIETGLSQLTGSLHRSTIAAAALMTSFSMMIGTSIMIDSFRKTVDYWIQQSLRADLYLTPRTNMTVKHSQTLPLSLREEIAALPGVADIDFHYEWWIDSPCPDSSGTHRKIKLTTARFDIIQKYQRYTFIGSPPSSMETGSPGVLVNESFSNHHKKFIGDTLPLRTPAGTVEFSIIGICQDYSTDSGQILMDRATYQKLWKENLAYGMSLYVKPGMFDPTRDQIQKNFAPAYPLAVYSNQELKGIILSIFDQTFAITLGLRLIAIIVAFAGMFLTITALISERTRQWAILRSLGVSRMGMLGIATTESVAIALVGWMASCMGGLGVAWLLAFVINRSYFGWTVQWHPDPTLFAVALFFSLTSTLLACILSVWKQLQTPQVESLRYE